MPWLEAEMANQATEVSVQWPCESLDRDCMFDLGNVLEGPMPAIWHGDAGHCARNTFLANRPNRCRLFGLRPT